MPKIMYKGKNYSMGNGGEVDSVLSSTSENPVQNKIVTEALENKLGVGDIADWAKAATKPVYTASEVGADTQGAADTALSSAKSYTDTKISDLVNGAPETLDTLKEIADAMSNNNDVVEALDTAIGAKANASDLTAHINDKNNPHEIEPDQIIFNSAVSYVNKSIGEFKNDLLSWWHSNCKSINRYIISGGNGSNWWLENWSNNAAVIQEGSIWNIIPIVSYVDYNDYATFLFSSVSDSAGSSELLKLELYNNEFAHLSRLVDLSNCATIDQLNGKQDILIKQAISDPTTDWNTITESGLYTIGYNGLIIADSHGPLGVTGWGLLTVINTGLGSANIASIRQIYEAGSGGTYIRNKWQVNGSWSSWSPIYSHPSYTAKSSGLYKVTIDEEGHVSATTAVTKADITALGIPAQDTNTTYNNATQSAAGLESAADKTKLDGIETGANKYSLPAASSTVRGGVKIGYTANGKNYPVQLSNEQMYVNVPWTDNNTTYSAFKGATASASGEAGLVPAPTAGNQAKYLRADGTWQTPPDTNTTYLSATTSANGLMSKDDKAKLDGIATGAQVNSITGVKGNAESSYRTGNVNITPTNIGAVSISGTTMTGVLVGQANANYTTAQFRNITMSTSAPSGGSNGQVHFQYN